ncbi:DNA polymerase III subunit gamma and tau [Arthrobacter echini]|uniref:DNA polymerase III subunit gamma/tau n=1 Tax=Arthrobacter echini TaxID=1529066 RepID=A0A5D0XPG9_9MICC|nr:DNA polymerase III subunit gamma and tau [Arthrobacter echini]TYC98432.1 DNA polymerase III subunit gamma and tau [Arthrobacter echini]
MSTALYRRYRPETFADVIGQEHVTDPLMAAIDKDRINHAYLFSGPRGCGKTTSARILARCLNCAQGPTSTPCGVCDSCVGLARNGSGSLDVIEIDAASHGGVDDARDLRERATFAPVRDRFKIFIIDEAHMVTSAGFNALLKIVEEPPEHILFIFATTEPDKVIGTIRSRTHHYPFRLVPPEPLMAYLELLCRQENVPVAPGVLSLVIRAGGGSVRDSLSVLDQLMAGAGENGLDYELAVSLLGYTHAALLDDVVDSMAAGDAGTVFHAVDRVIQTGHDPRRFVEDLLERFRDLIVINAVPEGAASILRGVPDDQLNRMRTQANQLGAGELSRAADVTNTALTEMTGATSPRLHLELLCARLLLPAADATVRGTLARVDRIERRLEYAGGTPVVEPRVEAGVETEAAPEAAPEEPARPAERSRLEGVPRNAEEAAAQWSLPTAAPDPHAPAVPAAARTGSPSAPDASADWGASWGMSTDAGFSGPEPASKTAATTPGAASGADRPAAQASEPSAGDRPASGASLPSSDRAAESPSTAGISAESDGPPPNGPGKGDPSSVGQPMPGDPTPSRPADVDRSVAPGESAPTDADPSVAPSESAPADADRSIAPDEPAPAAPADADRSIAPVGPAPAAHSGLARPTDAQPASGENFPAESVPAQGASPRQDHAPSENIEMIRRAWPEIMNEVAGIKRATWLIVNVSAAPRSFDGNQLVLAFANQGNAIGFQRGQHMDNVKQAIHKVLGLTCSIEVVHDAGGGGGADPKAPAGPPAPTSDRRPAATTPAPERPAAPGPGHGQQPRQPGTASTPDRGPRQQPTQPEPASTPDRGPRQQPTRPETASTTNNGDPSPAVDPLAGKVGTPDPGADPPRRPRETPREASPARASTARRPPDEGVSGWDPTITDDSWALVEPPEEAFDPGAAWGSVPDDPSEPRSSASAGATRAPRPDEADRGDRAPAPQELTAHRQEQQPSAAPPSRSVVWSPPATPAPTGDIEGAAGIPGAAPNTGGGWNGPAATARAGASVTAPRPGSGSATEQREAAGALREKPVSRYQQLLDEGQRKRAEEAASTRGAVDLRFVEDEPSADDETLEDSGLVGRAAIERILNGRLVEERTPDGQ